MIKQSLWMILCCVVIVPNSNAMYRVSRVSLSPAAANCAQMSCVLAGKKKVRTSNYRCFPALEEQKRKNKEQIEKRIEQELENSKKDTPKE